MNHFLFSICAIYAFLKNAKLQTSPNVLDKYFLDNFMKTVGIPLEWDLDHDEYEFDSACPLNDEQCSMLKERIYQMIKKEVFKVADAIY